MVAEGVSLETAESLQVALLPFYVTPLTPHPSHRVYADLQIDPDDLSDIADTVAIQRGAWLGENQIPCPDDPTLVQLGLVLDRAMH